jgi:Ca-activated chloride channel family protein
MTFIWPVMLFLLVLIPLLIALYLRLQQRRKRISADFGRMGWAQTGAGRDPGVRRHVPPALSLAGLTILIVALARPQALVSVPRVEGTVILAFDVSGSMSADDMEPTRMEAAKAAALDFVERQSVGVLIGVVSFSEGGFSIQPPTSNQDEITTAINRLTPQRGTSLGYGIYTALNAIAMSRGAELIPTPGEGQEDEPQPPLFSDDVGDSAVIVLLTDGENTAPPDPYEAAGIAAEVGVRIYPIGIGSDAGTVLEVNGFTVHTRLDEGMLEQIADITNGAYFNATSQEDLQAIYDNLDSELVIKPEKAEVTSIFASASILILLAGGVLSLVWFGRLT